ncbi:MAG: hypothetical protein Tsb002_07610 [Wenzhouxiangellaceae bacterium]
MAQQYAADHLMQSLIGKLYQILTGGDDVAAPASDNFIAWCTPGIPFDTADFDFASKGLAGQTGDETRRLLATASDFSRLVNFVPDPSGIFNKEQQDTTLEQSGTLIWNVYKNVLQFSEVAAGQLTDAEKAKLEKFRNLLRTTKTVTNIVTDETSEVTVDGPVLEAYNAKMADYLDAVTEYNNKRISAMNSDDPLIVQDWALNSSNYRRRVKVANDAWISGGYKNEVDQMNAYIDQVTKRDLTLLKADLQDTFDRGKLTDLVSGADFWNTTVIPGGFAAKSGWSQFSFSQDNVSSYESSETNSWSAGASYGRFLFGASGSTSGSITKEFSSLDTSNFKMSFEVVQVPISRPWFSPEFLKNTAWRWAQNSGMSPLSDGNKPPAGQLVAYPSTAVFVRNIQMDFKELHQTESDFRSHITAKTSVGWGPFKVSGSYTRDKHTHSFNSTVGEQGLVVPGMQLIALKCSLLPKAPNPSPDVTDWN